MAFAVTVASLPTLFTGHEIPYWQVALLLVGYVAYLALNTTAHNAVSGFTSVLLWFALPIALLGVLGSVAAAQGAERHETPSGSV